MTTTVSLGCPTAEVSITRPIDNAPRELSTLTRLRGLLDVTRLVRDEADLPTVLAEIARTISGTLGFKTVVVNLYRPAWDDFEVTTVHGSAEAEQQLLGDTQGWAEWTPLLDDRYLRRGAYFVPSGEFDWTSGDRRSFIPQLERSAEADAWDAEDALFVPMRHSEAGHLLGILSVDEPASGVRPSDEDLDVLVAVAQHAALAVESAQRAADAARHRAALETLARISSHLTATVPVNAVLQSICDGVRDALGFRRVCVQLLNGAGDGFEPRAAAGWTLGDEAVRVPITRAEFLALLEPQFEVEGCYLLMPDEAYRRIPPEHRTYTSSLNGRGPAAWNRHWLVVPLTSRAGELTGYVWADDPDDRLLPTRERLQALRMFANQTQTALDFAWQFEAMRAANEESRAIVEASPLAIVVVDTDEVVRAWNAAAERIYGWSAAEVVGRKLPLIPPDGRSDFEEHRRRLFAGETLQNVRMRRVRRDGSVVEVSCSAAPVHGPDGTVVRAVAVHADMTEVRQVEEAARRSEQLSQLVCEHASDLIAILDLEGRTVYVSPSEEALLGYPPEELVGKVFGENVHPEDRAGAAAVLLAAVGGESKTFVARVRHRSGHWVWLEGSPTVISDDDGNPDLILTISRDVSDRYAHRDEAAALTRPELRLA